MAEAATFSRDSLISYEKQPQTQISDKANPFAGATPAKAADPAAIAAARAEAEALENNGLSGTSDQTNEDGTDLSGDGSDNSGDQTATGDGTSDDNADSSTASADPGDETGTSNGVDGEDGRRLPVSPRRRALPRNALQEVLRLRSEEKDLMEGYKEYGRMQDQRVKELEAQLAGKKPATAATPDPVVPTADDDPMPDLADPDINFDTDKLRTKTAKWTRDQAAKAARAAVEQVTGQGARKQLETEVNTKVATFSADKPDFDAKVTHNQILLDNQLCPEASLIVAKSDFTGDLLYYFGNNTKEAIRIARLTPVEQVAEVGRLAGRIEARKEAAAGTGDGARPNSGTKTTPATGAKPVTKPKSITQAPPPPQATRAAGRPNERDETDPT